MKPPSLFETLSSALELDGAALPADAAARAAVARETALFADRRLPTLTLPARETALVGRSAARPPLAGLLALAACLGLAFASQRGRLGTDVVAEDGQRVKGASGVRIFWMHGADVQPFAAGNRLVNGDRILAEVSAHGPSAAYWAAFNGKGELLGAPEAIAASRLDLAAGERKSFEESLMLVGDDEDEVLAVALCPPQTPVPTVGFFKMALLPGRSDSMKFNCEVMKFQLR